MNALGNRIEITDVCSFFLHFILSVQFGNSHWAPKKSLERDFQSVMKLSILTKFASSVENCCLYGIGSRYDNMTFNKPH